MQGCLLRHRQRRGWGAAPRSGWEAPGCGGKRGGRGAHRKRTYVAKFCTEKGEEKARSPTMLEPSESRGAEELDKISRFAIHMSGHLLKKVCVRQVVLDK